MKLLITIACSAILVSGCMGSLDSKDISSASSQQSQPAGGSGGVGGGVVAENFTGTAGVKNVNQLLLSMTSVTNISPSTLAAGGSNNAITKQYTTISPFLSANGAVTAITPAMLLSITGLAGQVCQVFAANEAAKPNVLSGTGISFSAGSWGTQFTSASSNVTANVISALSTQFWGRAPTADEASALTSAIQSAVNTVPDSGSQGVQDVLIVPCTVMLASPAFLLG